MVNITHLSIGVQGNSSVLVKDCSFTYANRVNGDLIHVIYPRDQTIGINVIVDEYYVADFVTYITITMRNVSITENFGGGLTFYF